MDSIPVPARRSLWDSGTKGSRALRGLSLPLRGLGSWDSRPRIWALDPVPSMYLPKGWGAARVRVGGAGRGCGSGPVIPRAGTCGSLLVPHTRTRDDSQQASSEGRRIEDNPFLCPPPHALCLPFPPADLRRFC